MRPEEIEQREFASSMRGFDRNEVRAFLKRIAGDVRDLERQSGTEDDNRFEAEAAVEPLSSTPALVDVDRFGALGDRIANLLRQAHESAAQLRESANEEAEVIRSDAQVELEEAQTEAARLRAEAADLRSEAEALRSEAAQDAIEIKAQAEIEGTARLDDRQAQIDQAEAEVAAERELAMSELADARGQVGELLQEARAQSEFIRLESEEIIRAKVRTNMDQAQKRIDVLRNTELSSRDRIVSAQRELESALSRLETEPVPGLGEGTEDEVLLEAEERGLETNYGMGLAEGSDEVVGYVDETDSNETIDADEFASSVNTTAEIDTAETDTAEVDIDIIDVETLEVDDVEVDDVEVDDVEVDDVEVDDAEVLEVEEVEEVEAAEYDEPTGTFAAVPSTNAMPTSDLFPAEEPDEGVGAPFVKVSEFADAPDPSDRVAAADALASDDDLPGQDSASDRSGLLTSGEAPVFGSPKSSAAADFYRGSPSFEERAPAIDDNESGSRVEGGDGVDGFSTSEFNAAGPESRDSSDSVNSSDSVDSSDSGGFSAESDAPPENEDALARLVREAMQRAVESAKSSED